MNSRDRGELSVSDTRQHVEPEKEARGVLSPELVATPAGLAREPLIRGYRGLGWISDEVMRFNERSTPSWWRAGLLVALFLLVLGVVMVAYLVTTGIGVWGVGHPVMWGWATINFVWWIGIGHAGTLISAILFLLRQHWRTAVNRVAEAMTIFAVLCAALFPIIHVGRVWYIWWLLPIPTSNAVWPQFHSPLMWDVFAIATYLTVSVLFWYLGLVPDLALMRDRARRPVSRFFYGLFSLGWTGSQRQWHHYEKAYLIIAGLATALVVSVHSIVSLDFAATQLPGWHSTIFPPYFVAGAMFSGFGMVLTLVIPVRSLCGLENVITKRHIDLICKVTLATGSIVAYAFVVEGCYAWFGGKPYERFMILNRVTGPYWWAFLLVVACNFLAPQAFWFRKVRLNLRAVWVLSILINIGMWMERFVIVVGSLHRDFVPPNWSYYRPTWVDVCTFAGSFGLFFTFFLLFLRYLPVVAVSELKSIASNCISGCASSRQRLDARR